MTTNTPTRTGVTEAELRLIVQAIDRMVDQVADLNHRLDQLERDTPTTTARKKR